MTDEIRDKLKDAGVDVESVMERFMNNEALLERFMRKFKNDPNYQELLDAVARKDNEGAFTAAHTLKGVSGNLSLIELQKTVSDQCECFRAGDFSSGVAMMPQVTEEYQRIVTAINTIYP
jgi:hypothetical protein